MNNHRKLWEVWGQTNALYTQWSVRQGMNPYRQLVLYALDSREPITQARIAEESGLSRQTVSTVIRALKVEGLVTLTAAEGDRREKYVRLTEEGLRQAAETLGPLYQLEERVFALLGEERIREMLNAVSLFNTVFAREMEVTRDAR